MQPLLLLTLLASANAIVIRPVANMYSGPSDEKDVVSQAIYATNIEVLESQGPWSRIRTPDDYTGWVSSSAILPSSARYAARGRVAEVANLFAHLYREPSVTKHQPLLTVPFETRLEVTAEPEADSGRWIQVRLPTDGAGWVQRGDVTFEPRKLSIAEMIDLSKRFLGLPYTWGGTSSFGYDCSGYTQMLCRRRGILMPRDAGPQAGWAGMEKIGAVADLKPGDLLYFGSSPEKIVHTGLYIGNGEFIHATTNQKPIVQISRIDDWTKTLVAMRRPR